MISLQVSDSKFNNLFHIKTEELIGFLNNYNLLSSLFKVKRLSNNNNERIYYSSKMKVCNEDFSKNMVQGIVYFFLN